MQLYQLVDTRLAGRQAPDIFRIQYQQVGRYAGAGALIDLSSYLDPGYAGQFGPAFWQAVTLGGKPFALPHHTDTFALYYNVDFLHNIGVEMPRTLDQAADADLLVSNHWRAEYPPIPLLRFVQSVECWSGRIASARLKQTFASVPRGGRAGFRAGRRMARCSAAPSGSSGSAASGRRSRAAPLPSAAMSSLPKKSAFICRSAP
jgi:hypothetical protein